MCPVRPRRKPAGCLSILPLLCLGLSFLPVTVGFDSAFATTPFISDSASSLEFSARLTWRVGKHSSKAQLFVKGDRYRIEHLGGVKTDLGYASVTIVRLDKQKVWYVLSQRRLVVAVPLTTDYVLPLSVRLEGEVSRSLIGDAVVGENTATLYDVEVNRNGHQERYYEWVDEPRQLLLKLVSQDRNWSVEYERVILSTQPEYFFETPLGYRTIEASEIQAEKG